MSEFTKSGFTLTLRALRELDYHDTIKVISSRTGKVLIHNYNANKQFKINRTKERIEGRG